MNENNSKHNIYRSIMLILVTAIVTFMITSVTVYNFIKVKYSSTELINYLSKIKLIIDKYYLNNVDEKKLMQGAIKGYVEGLEDEYSEYFTSEEMKDFTETTLGNYVGIGIYMTKNTKDNTIMVINPIAESPAYEAGILPGDIISKIDGKTYTGDQMTEAANYIKGEEGTKVNLEIIRDDKTLTFEIERKNIKINHINSKVLSGNIGYLGLTSFDEGTADEFKQKYEELQKKGIKSLIIDLRNNGGGLVKDALEIAEMMTKKDETLLITVDKDNKEEVTKSKKDPTINMSIILLTNEYTASASEILAGALKDNSKAQIVGKTTYGKGVIQQLLTLEDGTGLKITTNEYYTPSKNKINKVGIKPDYEVELPENLQNKLVIDEKQDTQLQKAVELLK